MNRKKWLYSFLESVFLVAIVTYYFHNNYNFFNLNPHPLLIITVIVTLQYGLWPGILNAFISSSVYTYVYSLTGKSIYILFSEFNNYKFFIMLFLTAVVLGIFKDNYQSKINKLKSEKKELDQQARKLKERFDEITFIKDEIKKQIVGTEKSILSLYERAKSLEELDPESLYDETMSIFKKYLSAEVISLYLLDEENNLLKLKVRLGGDSDMENSIILKDYPCLNKVIYQKETNRRHTGCPYNRNRAVFVAPIISREKVVGIVNIEKIDFEKITEYSYQLFKVIMNWLNEPLAKAITFEEKVTNEKYYGQTNIMKFNYFKNRLSEEEKRESKFNMDFQVLKYKNMKGLDLLTIDNIFTKLLRKKDIIAYNEKEDVIYILFPATHKEFLNIIEDRISENAGDVLERISP